VGSGQKQVRKFLDQLIWIDIDEETGLERVLRRDGDYLETEMRIWQLREREHFNRDNTRDCATIRIDGKYFI
jgi:gluconate kinase